MAWPTDDLDTTDLDAGTDSPSSARSDLLALMQKVKSILAQRAVASGICDLDATTKVPVARIPQGAGSGLDADTLDGLQPTNTATGNTIVNRDASGNCSFNYIFMSQNFGFNAAQSTRNSDTIFYSSANANVQKNTATGMRSSLSVYSKAEVDALLANAGDLELISSSVGFSGVSAVETTGDFSGYSSLQMVGRISSATVNSSQLYCDIQDGGSWRTLSTDYLGTYNFGAITNNGPILIAHNVLSETAFLVNVLDLGQTQKTALLSHGGHSTVAFFSSSRRSTAATVSGVRLRVLSGTLSGSVYLYGRKL